MIALGMLDAKTIGLDALGLAQYTRKIAWHFGFPKTFHVIADSVIVQYTALIHSRAMATATIEGLKVCYSL